MSVILQPAGSCPATITLVLYPEAAGQEAAWVKLQDVIQWSIGQQPDLLTVNCMKWKFSAWITSVMVNHRCHWHCCHIQQPAPQWHVGPVPVVVGRLRLELQQGKNPVMSEGAADSFSWVEPSRTHRTAGSIIRGRSSSRTIDNKQTGCPECDQSKDADITSPF